MKSGIYVIRNLVTGRIYVGSSVNVRRRLLGHRRLLLAGQHVNARLQASFNKHGEASFEFRVLEIMTPAGLLAREQHWIDLLKPHYNIAAIAGAPMTGRKHTEASRQAIRAWHKGRKKAAAHVAKVGQALKGHAVSHEVRARLRAFRLGMKTGPRSAEVKAQISVSKRKSYRFLDPQGAEVSFTGLMDFCAARGLNATCMAAVHRGKRQAHQGWTRYVE